MTELAGLTTPKVSQVKVVPILKDHSTTVRSNAFTQYSNGYSIRTSRYRYQWGDKGEFEQNYMIMNPMPRS